MMGTAQRFQGCAACRNIRAAGVANSSRGGKRQAAGTDEEAIGLLQGKALTPLIETRQIKRCNPCSNGHYQTILLGQNALHKAVSGLFCPIFRRK
jgi:hypothetical protein